LVAYREDGQTEQQWSQQASDDVDVPASGGELGVGTPENDGVQRDLSDLLRPRRPGFDRVCLVNGEPVTSRNAKESDRVRRNSVPSGTFCD
jgi:hypothetical protein